MKTIALRFGEHFAPECGTIIAHQKVIDKIGFVWYGKLGSNVSNKIITDLKKNDNPCILLISSGKSQRYWAFIEDITSATPPIDEIPDYYRDKISNVKTWFKIKRFQEAPKNIMSKCIVVSSGNELGETSKHSMSPYFIIQYDEMEM